MDWLIQTLLWQFGHRALWVRTESRTTRHCEEANTGVFSVAWRGLRRGWRVKFSIH